MTEWVRENLWSIMNAAEDRARENGRQFNTLAEDRCTACGRKVGANPLMVEVDIGGNVMLPGDPHSGEDAYSQGWWEIGPECAKRVLTRDEIKRVRAAMKGMDTT